MLRLSIVIPVYNLEGYISETLDSCLEQNIPHSDYEIICINDGSTDNSESVILGYAERYPNIRLFTQENAGVSAARNLGISLAEGRYIWFVDGDDIIVSNCLSEILSMLEKGGKLDSEYTDNGIYLNDDGYKQILKLVNNEIDKD